MRKNKRVATLVIVSLFVIFVISAFYNGLVVRKYTLHTDKFNKDEKVRVVLISDLHSSIFGENQSELLTLIKKQKPDVILLAGDIIDDVAPVAGAELFLAGIQGTAPIYYVSGNHEYWSGQIEWMKNTIRKYGVTVLENNYERLRIGNSLITVAGVDDPWVEMTEGPDFDWQEEMHKAFDELERESGFKILMAHRPEGIGLYKKFSFDLVVSGHAHGGQVRIPVLLNGLFAPDQGWLPKYAGGVYRHGSLTHIVGRGVSFNPRLPRIFNPPEIVVIDILGKTNDQ